MKPQTTILLLILGSIILILTNHIQKERYAKSRSNLINITELTEVCLGDHVYYKYISTLVPKFNENSYPMTCRYNSI